MNAKTQGLSSAPPSPAGKRTAKRSKTCRKCGETKPTAWFPRRPAMRDGLSSWCKVCHTAACRAWRDRKRDERLQAELDVLEERLADLRESETRRRERLAAR
jgi:hypothetical protein